MRINNNNSLDLTASKEETLVLTLQDGDAVVTFSGLAKGALTKGNPHQFTIPSMGTDLPLQVRATFKGTSGGFAEVRVSDTKGNVAPFTFTQFRDSKTDAVVFFIDIE